MKKYILIILVFISCGGSNTIEEDQSPKAYKILSGSIDDLIFVVEIDRCEYIVFDGSQKGGIVHKQNCKNEEIHHSKRKR
jgi:hypothetical protein